MQIIVMPNASLLTVIFPNDNTDVTVNWMQFKIIEARLYPEIQYNGNSLF